MMDNNKYFRRGMIFANILNKEMYIVKNIQSNFFGVQLNFEHNGNLSRAFNFKYNNIEITDNYVHIKSETFGSGMGFEGYCPITRKGIKEIAIIAGGE